MCDQHCECVCESALPSLPPDFEAMDNLFQRIERNAHLARRVLTAADDISKTDPHPGKMATILLDLAGEFENFSKRQPVVTSDSLPERIRSRSRSRRKRSKSIGTRPGGSGTSRGQSASNRMSKSGKRQEDFFKASSQMTCQCRQKNLNQGHRVNSLPLPVGSPASSGGNPVSMIDIVTEVEDEHFIDNSSKSQEEAKHSRSSSLIRDARAEKLNDNPADSASSGGSHRCLGITAQTASGSSASCIADDADTKTLLARVCTLHHGFRREPRLSSRWRDLLRTHNVLTTDAASDELNAAELADNLDTATPFFPSANLQFVLRDKAHAARRADAMISSTTSPGSHAANGMQPMSLTSTLEQHSAIWFELKDQGVQWLTIQWRSKHHGSVLTDSRPCTCKHSDSLCVVHMAWPWLQPIPAGKKIFQIASTDFGKELKAKLHIVKACPHMSRPASLTSTPFFSEQRCST